MCSIWKAEQQQSGYYNLVFWKTRKKSIRKLILNQPGLPGITKDESKAIASCHVTAETAAVCVIKSEIKKIKEKKEIEETQERYRWRFT